MVLSVQHNSVAMNAYRNLLSAGASMGKSIEKLSSGFRINTAADGPADLIISEQLRAQMEGLERAIRNTTETKNLLAITEGALGEVQNILRNMKKLAIHAANTGVVSPDQVAADQAEMDCALQAIDRILGTTGQAGQKILENMMKEGKLSSSRGYGADASGQPLGPSDSSESPEGDGNTLSGGTFLLGGPRSQVDENGSLVGDKTFTLVGQDDDPAGLASFSFTAGTGIAEVVAKLREFAIPAEEAAALAPGATPPAGSQGGVPDAIRMDMAALSHLQGLGDDEAASYLTSYLDNSNPAAALTLGDAKGMPVKKLNDADRRLLDFSEHITTLSTSGLGGVEITDRFDPDGAEETRLLTLADMYAGGLASLEKNPDAAMKIIDKAIKDIAGMRAQIGAIQADQLQAEENNLRSMLENITKSESAIRDTDMAKEMIEFTRTQVISQVGTQMLAAANQQGRDILNLLA